MENIEIEYLDEYKDLVLPGINTNNQAQTATTTSSSLDIQVASASTLASRSQRRRISSDSSGSSSIDADIFQKLFDGKFLDDELLNEETDTNVKDRPRRNLSSSSSDSNDALDALFNPQAHKIHENKRRERLESYDSIDDLGEALMGSNHKLLLAKTSSTSSRKVSSQQKGVPSVVKTKQSSGSSIIFKAKPAGLSLNGSSSSSSSSNKQTKKPVTIIKPQKTDLKPPKHEPKTDPLHLQDLPCDSDSDSSYVYESDFYGYDDSDEDDAAHGSKHIIDISTDTSVTTSVAETVTPVVSDDDSSQQAPQSPHQQSHHQHDEQQSLTPIGKNERLQFYLNNLSAAETPPSKHKHSRLSANKSLSNEKLPTDTQVNDSSSAENIGQKLAEGEQQLEEPSTTTTNPRRLFDESSNQLPPADYVDDNLTYETLERLSLNLAEQIVSIDAERTIEFEKRSGSKPRSHSISQPLRSSLPASHVRKLTYSNEALNTAATGKNSLRRAKSEGAFSKGKRGKRAKKRADTTEEQTTNVSLTPKKVADKPDQKIIEDCNDKTKDVIEPVTKLEPVPEPILETVAKPVQEPVPKVEPVSGSTTEPVKRKRGRPRKNKLVAEKPAELPVSVEPTKQNDMENRNIVTLENQNFEPIMQKIEMSSQLDQVDKQQNCNINGSYENQKNSTTQITDEDMKIAMEENMIIASEIVTIQENLITEEVVQQDIKCTNNNKEKEIVSPAKDMDLLEHSQETETQEAEMTAKNSVVQCVEETPVEQQTNEQISELKELAILEMVNEESSKISERTEEAIKANLKLAEENVDESIEMKKGKNELGADILNSCYPEFAEEAIITAGNKVITDSTAQVNEAEAPNEMVFNPPQDLATETAFADDMQTENLEKETVSPEDLPSKDISDHPDDLGKETVFADDMQTENLGKETVSSEVLPSKLISNLPEDLGKETVFADMQTENVEKESVSSEVLPSKVISDLPEDLGKQIVSTENLPMESTAETASRPKITRVKRKTVGSVSTRGRKSRSGNRNRRTNMDSPSISSPALTESEDFKDNLDEESKNTKVDTQDIATEQQLPSPKQKKSEINLNSVSDTTEIQNENLSTVRKSRGKKRKLEISEETQITDSALDANIKDSDPMPHPASTAEEEQANANQMISVESQEICKVKENVSTKKKMRQTKRRSKSAKSISKQTESKISESNFDDVSSNPISSDPPSISQQEASSVTPSETVESNDIQHDVEITGRKKRKVSRKFAKRQSKQAEIQLPSDVPQTDTEQLEITETEKISTDSKLICENMAENKGTTEEERDVVKTVAEQQDIKDATASESTKQSRPRLPKEIKEVQATEGRTTRSRAGTPAASRRFRSQEKESTAKTGKEQDKKIQVPQPSVGRATARSKERAKHLPQNKQKESIFSLTETQETKKVAKVKTKRRIGPKNGRAAVKETKAPAVIATDTEKSVFSKSLSDLHLDRATPINLGPSIASTPSTSSSSNSVRRLRVLVKKSKMLLNLDQKEENVVSKASTSQRADERDIEATSYAIVQLNEGKVDKESNSPNVSMGEDELVDIESIDTEMLTNLTPVSDQQLDKNKDEIAAKDDSKLKFNMENALELNQHQMANQSNLTETTGVHDHNDDGESSKQTDDSQSDGGPKSKHVLQVKSIMAPPTTPQRDASTAKTVMRRPLNSVEVFTPPSEKRRHVETKANAKLKASPTTPIQQLKSSPFGSPKQVSPVLSKKPEAVTSLTKFTLSSLLSADEESPKLNNSVVITKTSVGPPSEPFQRVEAMASPASTSSGINISVSVVPEAISQPKKKLTQAETAKKMLSAMKKKSQTTSKNDTKSLPPNKSRKSETEKQSYLPPKTSVPLEEERATLQVAGKKSLPHLEKHKKPEKSERKSMLPKMLDADALGTEASTSSKVSLAAAAATLASAKSEKKREAHKGEMKLVGKAKTRNLAEQLEIAGQTRTAASPPLSIVSLELGKEPSKRISKKQLHKRDLSMTRSLAEATVDRIGGSASRESSGERKKRDSRALKGLTVQGTSKESQRQPKKSQKLMNDVDQQEVKQQPEQEMEREEPHRMQQPQQEHSKKQKRTLDLPKKQQHLKLQEQEKPQASQGRKRKLPTASASEAETPIYKRTKHQTEKPTMTPSVAFPVRITAASSVSQPSELPLTTLQPLATQAKTIVKFPAVPRTRKLRVRLNRSVVNNWLKEQQAIRAIQEQQMEEASQAVAPVEAAQLTPAVTALSRQQRPPAKAVPLPVMEVKAEQEAVEDQQLQQEALRPQLAERQEAPLQVVVPIPRTVSNPTTISSRNDDNVVNSSGITADVPVASGSNDGSTFGTTKMFSFLYPSRYQRSYGQVGLDFCCPNLNGPMQAIDPTRLHSKAEVPVLELPQYMVISTKIFSKQDKNIPQKVRAKLEQMAAKDGQPCVVQSVQITDTSVVAAAPVDASVPAAAPFIAPAPNFAPNPTSTSPSAVYPALGHIERLAKPLSLTLPRSALLTKETNPNSAAVPPNVSNSPAVVNASPVAAVNPLEGLLQLPPICPADKQRMELQTRIQLFDLMLQNLVKSVTSLTVLDRQRVIENFVRKSTLQPIDVEVGTKLLENYVYHLSATTDNVSAASPNLRSNVMATATPSATSQATSSSSKKTSSAAVANKTDEASDRYGRPIYDRSRNVIGYEYKHPRLVSSTSSPRSPQQQQTSTTATSNKPSVPTAVVGAKRVAQRAGSGNTLSFQPSPKQKTYSRNANNSQMVRSTASVAVDKAKQSTVGASNHNLYIVNQVLLQEECILPDGVGMADATEIKGEVDDVEILL